MQDAHTHTPRKTPNIQNISINITFSFLFCSVFFAQPFYLYYLYYYYSAKNLIDSFIIHFIFVSFFLLLLLNSVFIFNFRNKNIFFYSLFHVIFIWIQIVNVCVCVQNNIYITLWPVSNEMFHFVFFSSRKKKKIPAGFDANIVHPLFWIFFFVFFLMTK